MIISLDEQMNLAEDVRKIKESLRSIHMELDSMNRVVLETPIIDVIILENNTYSIDNSFFSGSLQIVGFDIFNANSSCSVKIGGISFDIPAGQSYSIKPLYDHNTKCWLSLDKAFTVDCDNIVIITLYLANKNNLL